MKPFLTAAPFALLLGSCALFAYGTGRFNPINANLESGFTITAKETHYLNLTLPAARVSATMSPVLSSYPPENLVQPYAQRTLSLRNARWQPANTPSGWSVAGAGGSLGLELRQTLGSYFSVGGENRAEVFSDLNLSGATLKLGVSIPASTPPGTYPITGLVGLSGNFIPVRIGVNVLPATSTNAPKNGELGVSSDSSVNALPGGSYTLSLYLHRAEIPFIPNLAESYLETFGYSSNEIGRVRGDEWRVTNAALPARWELEWLEGNLNVRIGGERTVIGWNRIRTLYRLVYTDLKLLLGLRAIGAGPGQYAVTGTLVYRDAPVEPIRWMVTVK
jgi:hypothetical protein